MQTAFDKNDLQNAKRLLSQLKVSSAVYHYALARCEPEVNHSPTSAGPTYSAIITATITGKRTQCTERVDPCKYAT